MKKILLYSGILLWLFGCSDPSKSTEQVEGSEKQETQVASQEEAPTGSDASDMDFYQLLVDIPEKLLQHELGERVGQYFSFVLERAARNGMTPFHKTDDYWAFGYHREDKDGFYDIDRLRMWRFEDRVIIGWTDNFEHEKFASKEQVRSPSFFVFEKGKWSRYPAEQFLPVAFATSCFFSPYDDRVLVHTEDEVGTKGQYLLAWKNGKFEIEQGGSPFMTYDFQRDAEEEFLNSSRLSNEQLSKLNDHFEKGTSLLPVKDLIFPKDFAGFAEKKIGNTLPESKIEIKPIVRQSYAEVEVYVFSMSLEAEAQGGELIFFRTMKDRQWISEVSEFDGSYTGAVPEPFTVDYEFNQAGFFIAVKAGIYFMAFPDMWFGSIDIPWEVKEANTVKKTFVQIQTDGILDKFGYDTRETTEPVIVLTDELSTSWRDERERLDAFDNYQALFYEQFTEGQNYGQFKLTIDQQLQGELNLRRLYQEATGTPPIKKAKTFMTDSASIVTGLRSIVGNQEPTIKRLSGDVFIYEGEEYSILFNTLTLPSSPGDYFDEAFEEFKAKFYSKFTMVRGTMQELSDLTGDGQSEFLLTDLGGYSTTIEKSFTIYSLDASGVFKPLIDFNTTFEGGVCEVPLGTDISLEATPGGELILTSEIGKDNRPPGEVIRKCESRYYQETYQWDAESQVFRRSSFQEVEKP